MLNNKFLFIAATLVAMSGCGKNFEGRYEGVEINSANSYYPSSATMNLKQDGDLVSGDYTVQRQQTGTVTYRLTARAEKSDTLEGVQLTVQPTAGNTTYGQMGYMGSYSACTYLGGTLSAPEGKQITGSISQGGVAANPQYQQYGSMCSFNLNLTKVSDK